MNISTGAERSSGSRDNSYPYVCFSAKIRKEICQLTVHVKRQRVQTLWSIERYCGDAFRVYFELEMQRLLHVLWCCRQVRSTQQQLQFQPWRRRLTGLSLREGSSRGNV